MGKGFTCAFPVCVICLCLWRDTPEWEIDGGEKKQEQFKGTQRCLNVGVALWYLLTLVLQVCTGSMKFSLSPTVSFNNYMIYLIERSNLDIYCRFPITQRVLKLCHHLVVLLLNVSVRRVGKYYEQSDNANVCMWCRQPCFSPKSQLLLWIEKSVGCNCVHRT